MGGPPAKEAAMALFFSESFFLFMVGPVRVPPPIEADRSARRPCNRTRREYQEIAWPGCPNHYDPVSNASMR